MEGLREAHFYLTLLGVLGIQCVPQGRQLPLYANHRFQQSIQIPSDGQNVIFLTKSGYQQQPVPAYLSQNGVVYLRDEPQQPPEPGYVESIYNWFSGEQEMKPHPESMMPPPSPPSTGENPQPENGEPSLSPEESSSAEIDKEVEINSSKPNAEDKSIDKKPLKLVKKKTSNLEDLEPDAEIIPDSVKNPQKPIARGPPFLYPNNPGIIPGQNFYILNTPNQFVGGPLFGYSPINNPLRPQPSVRFHGAAGFPHRFLILGQHPAVQNQGGQAVILVGGSPDESLRSIHAQKVQVPAIGLPLQGRQEDFATQHEENLILQQDQPLVHPGHLFQKVNPQDVSRQQISTNQNLLASIAEQRNQLLQSQHDQQQHLKFAQQQLLTHATQLYQFPPFGQPFLDPSQIHRVDTRTPFSPVPSQSDPNYLSRGITTSLADENGPLEDDSETIDAQYEASGDSDNEATKEGIELVHSDLSENPAVAHSKPSAIAVAGRGGSAQAYPSGTALAGPQGLAVSNPSATALAGPTSYKSKQQPDQ